MPGRIPEIGPGDTPLTTEVPGNRINQGSALGANISVFGDAAEQIAATYEKAALLGETTRAQNQLSFRTSQLEQQASQDTDLSAGRHQYYTDQLNQAVQDSQQHISLPTAKAAFAQDANSTAAIVGLKINAIRTKKYIDLNKGELETFQQNQETNYLNAISPADKERAMLESDRKFQEATEGGYMSRKDAAAAQIKRNQTWDENQAMLDRHADPDATIKELQKGVDGAYKNLTPMQREKIISSTLEFKRKTEVDGQELTAIARNNTEASLLEKHFDNKLTEKEVQDLQSQGQISDQFANSMLKNLAQPVAAPHGVDKFKGYQDIVNKISDPKTKLTDINNVILDGLTKRYLTVDEAKNLWSSTMTDEDGQHISMSKMIQESRGKVPAEIIQRQKNLADQAKLNQSWWQAAMNTIDTWGRHNEKTQEDQTAIKTEFFKQAAAANKKSDQSIPLARTLINKDNLKVNPYVSKASEKGTIMMDSKGNKARVFPDGRYEELN